MNVLNPFSIVRCICSEARAHVHVEKHLLPMGLRNMQVVLDIFIG